MLTGDMLRRAAHRYPNKAAILWNDTALSYRDLDASANRLAHALSALRLPRQAKIGMLSRAASSLTHLSCGRASPHGLGPRTRGLHDGTRSQHQSPRPPR